MRKTIRVFGPVFAAISLLMMVGCASKPVPQPLSYVAVERPSGPIKGGGQMVEAEHPKGGMYFWNFGFRPASDVGAYLRQAQDAAGSDVLRNADVQLKVPVFVDLVLFGFQFGGADTVKAN